LELSQLLIDVSHPRFGQGDLIPLGVCLLLSMANGRTGRSLRVLDETFVPDDRKAEFRRRLARLKGQIEGVERMLGENRPCAEILTQISAARRRFAGRAE